MKIVTKLYILMLSVVFLFMAGVSLYVMADRKSADQIFEIRKVDESNRLTAMLKLEGKPLYTYSFDYTYWDEMVDFIKSGGKNEEWAAQNLRESVKSYNSTAVWVYNAKMELVYSYDIREDGGMKEGIPLPGGAMQQLFANNNHFCHFYARTPDGLMEIRGATVHPTADEKRKTQSQGYFFTGRILSKNYTKEMAQGLGAASFTITDVPGKMVSQAADISKGIIRLSRVLKGWNGEVVGYVNVEILAPSFAAFHKFTKNILLAMVLFTVVVIGFIAFFITRWVNVPLRNIERSLEREDPSQIAVLLSRWDELGRVAQLIDNFFRQRRALVDEIDRRKVVEKELSAKLVQLKQFKDIAVGREVKMIELKKEVNKLSKELGRPEPYDASF